jgi:hypothetical protein
LRRVRPPRAAAARYTLTVRLVFALAVFAVASISACATLPVLTFVGDDGGGGGSVDGGARADVVATVDATPDRSVSSIDAGDSSTSDAAAEATCPTGLPPGATFCCGQIPCTGADSKKCAASCTNCENSCNVGQTCCLDTSGALTGCSAIACP